jgi:heme exporter protein A
MPVELRVSQLCVERGGRMVLDRVTLAAEQGAALVVTGPNGVGKTTLLRAIAGYLPVASGTIDLEGGNPELEVAEQLHYVAHQNAIKTTMTVRENLDFWSVMLDGEGTASVERALDTFHLSELASFPAGYLSAGQKRRTALARLLVARRMLWLLDEPTVALDAASRDAFIEAGNEHLDSGGIIIAATHIPLPFTNSRELPLGQFSGAAA